MLKDIVIIGAGPAGLKCGTILAEHNKNVVIYDKLERKDIGKKICTGALSKKSQLLLPELDSDIIDLECNSFDLYLNVNGSERKTFSEIEVEMIDRNKLGQFMLKQAIDSGVEFCDNSELASVNFKDKELKFKNGKSVQYSVLIDAEGSNSIIRRELNLKSSGILCSSFKVPFEENKLILFVDIKKYGLSIPFIFPHGKYAFAGLWNYSQYPITFKEANERFNNYCKERFGFEYLDKAGGYGLINSNYNGYKFDDTYLIGDAGGFAEAFYGEGIYWALKSGELVGKELSGLDVKTEWETFLSQKMKHDKLMNSFLSTYDKAAKPIKNLMVSMLNRGVTKFLTKSTGGKRAKKIFEEYVHN